MFSHRGNCHADRRQDKHKNILKSSFNSATLRGKKKDSKISCKLQSQLAFDSDVGCRCTSFSPLSPGHEFKDGATVASNRRSFWSRSMTPPAPPTPQYFLIYKYLIFFFRDRSCAARRVAPEVKSNSDWPVSQIQQLCFLYFHQKINTSGRTGSDRAKKRNKLYNICKSPAAARRRCQELLFSPPSGGFWKKQTCVDRKGKMQNSQ